ncbi:hypothetical protein ACI51X_05110 [Pectobacterium versatile]|uniref:hypothetical protein n=1 Tax=Pectobacterium versatile TaxID=2488639 RepID=UPI0020C01688|nr:MULTISPECIES: hypothetical protein [Pectobacterium]
MSKKHVVSEVVMISNKVKEYLKENGWWFDDSTELYENALLSVGISIESDIAYFFLHAESGTTFKGKKNDIYQLCWFIINTDYQLNIKSAHEGLRLPDEYIPLDGFEGGGGYFYNRKTGEVVELELGDKLVMFLNGELKPQWVDFNSFIEDFFEL